MISAEKPVVTVVHSLPGRVRARLSVAPRDVQRMLGGVREHPGMDSISFSPVTRSILARFNPHEISQEEIVLRIAFHLSLDFDFQPVRLLAAPEERGALGGIAAASAAGLAVSLLLRGLNLSKGSPTRWDWAAGGHRLGGCRSRLEGASPARDVRSRSPHAGLPRHGLRSRQLPHGRGGHLAGVLRAAPGRRAADRGRGPPRRGARSRKRPVPLRSDDRSRRGRSRARAHSQRPARAVEIRDYRRRGARVPQLARGTPGRIEGPRRGAGRIRANAAGNTDSVQLSLRTR